MYDIENVNVKEVVSCSIDGVTYFSNGLIMNIDNGFKYSGDKKYMVEEDNRSINLYSKSVSIDVYEDEKKIKFESIKKLEFFYLKESGSIKSSESSNLLDKILSSQNRKYGDNLLKRDNCLGVATLDFLVRVYKTLDLYIGLFEDVKIDSLDIYMGTLLNILNSKSTSIIKFMIEFDLKDSLEELVNEKELIIGKYTVTQSQKKALFKLINLLKKLEYKISIQVLISIISKFNSDEIHMICKFIEVHSFVSNKFDSLNKSKDLIACLEAISDINYYLKDLTSFMNYYIRLLFKEAYIKIENTIGFADVLYVYLDYIRLYCFCEEKSIDVLDFTLYPKNVTCEHSSLSKIVNENYGGIDLNNSIKNMEEENKMNDLFKNMVNSYRYLEHSGDIFSVIIPKSYSDLVNEGKRLSHCIAGYKYAVIKGTSKILFVRNSKELDMPYYTLEIRGSKVWQLRGYDNKEPNSALVEFIADWSVKMGLNIEEMNKYGI